MSRSVSIPLRDSVEDAESLKRLRRFSIEVWNLTQNWTSISSESATVLERLINNKLRVLYARPDQEQQLTGSKEGVETVVLDYDTKQRLLSDIVRDAEKLCGFIKDLERIVAKFHTANTRVESYMKLYPNPGPTAANILKTLSEALPDVIRMYEKEEIIEISFDALPEGDEVLEILRAEKASLHFWIDLGLEYYRCGRVDDFVRLLEVSGSEASLDYPEVENDQMRALDILAAYYVKLGHKERTSKERKRDLFSKATLLYTTADRIKMYDMPHLTGRAYFCLVEARASKVDQADQQFNFVLKQDAYDIPAMMGKAIIAFSKQDYKTALYFLKRALRQKPDGPADMRVGIGYCLA
ncbi:hypothetical protein NECAME_16163, partial [Necator americanus]